MRCKTPLFEAKILHNKNKKANKTTKVTPSHYDRSQDTKNQLVNKFRLILPVISLLHIVIPKLKQDIHVRETGKPISK